MELPSISAQVELLMAQTISTAFPKPTISSHVPFSRVQTPACSLLRPRVFPNSPPSGPGVQALAWCPFESLLRAGLPTCLRFALLLL